MKSQVTASMVLYNSKPTDYVAAIESFLHACPAGSIIVADNSEQPTVSASFKDPRVVYVHNASNLGFGVAHNRAFAMVADQSAFHFVLNPDVKFNDDVVRHLTQLLNEDPSIAAVMPRINYPDGTLQSLCKLVPSPLVLLVRRFVPIASLRGRINRQYELHDLSQDTVSDVPTISGCFILMRGDAFRAIGGFDERFFMYMEDVDLARRLRKTGRVIYDPRVAVVHAYGKGSYKDLKLLYYHIRSAFRYFNKWGWIDDSDRHHVNDQMLARLRLPRMPERSQAEDPGN